MRRLGVLLLCALALPVASARAWTWPVDGQILRGFTFDRDHPYAAGQHRGIEVAAAVGAPVLAPAQGAVTFAGTVPTSGKTVSIETPAGRTVTLLHLGSIQVRRGALVNEGSTVGRVGPSDDPNVPEPHVSMGIRTTADPQGYLDPLALLPARGSPVTPAAETPVPAVAATPTQMPVADPPAVEQSAEAGVEAPRAVERPAPVVPATAPRPVEPAAPQTAEPAPAVRPSSTEARQSVPKPAEAAADPPAVVQPTSSAAPVPVISAPSLEGASASDANVEPGDLGTIDRPTTQHRPASVGNGRASAPSAGHAAASVRGHGGDFPVWTVALALALLGLGAATWRQRVSAKAARMMQDPQRESVLASINPEERARRTGLAVCVGSAPPRSRGRVRGARGHLRALPPPEGEPSPDGEWDGRARHAGDGHGRSGGRLAA